MSENADFASRHTKFVPAETDFFSLSYEIDIQCLRGNENFLLEK